MIIDVPVAYPSLPTDDGLLDAELKKLGFENLDPTIHYSLHISTAALEKQGKTHFAFGLPGPIGVITTDTGTEEVAKKFMAQKRIIVRSFKSAKKLFEEVDKLGLKNDAIVKEKRQEYAEAEWQRMKGSILAIIRHAKFRGLIIDTATEVWELCRAAAFGKLTQVMPQHYNEVNNEFKELVKSAYESPALSSVWINKKGKEYKTGSTGKDSWTGRYERKGFGDMPFLVDVNLEHYFKAAQEPETGMSEEDIKALKPARFGIQVLDSRYEMLQLVGQRFEGDMCSFKCVAENCFPQTYGIRGIWD